MLPLSVSCVLPLPPQREHSPAASTAHEMPYLSDISVLLAFCAILFLISLRNIRAG
ncbi:hypothetical protein V6C53_04215 [Desulfocurvibacter africanus]|uniref:hypothetical protein n=1 Tax=Desulfocurvibacter africanus TaxID=873 RepID=UPI002FD966C6